MICPAITVPAERDREREISAHLIERVRKVGRERAIVFVCP